MLRTNHFSSFNSRSPKLECLGDKKETVTRMTLLAILLKIVARLKTLEALVATLLENKRTLFQMAPPTVK